MTPDDEEAFLERDLLEGVRRVRADPITIVRYDPEWPGLFARERDRLAPVLGGMLLAPLEHIGSTAVPGLPAKPIVDMLAVVEDWTVVGRVVPALRELSWVHAPEPGDDEQRRWSFCFPDTAWRTHHLHVVEEASTGWRTWLGFRDHLRGHPDDAAEYARIKSELAARDSSDRAAYRSGKAPFIHRILDQLETSR